MLEDVATPVALPGVASPAPGVCQRRDEDFGRGFWEREQLPFPCSQPQLAWFGIAPSSLEPWKNDAARKDLGMMGSLLGEGPCLAAGHRTGGQPYPGGILEARVR